MQDVTVVITRETAALTQAGFGMPLIVDSGGAVSYAECASLAEVAAAGFGSGTDVYTMAQAIFAQSPRPPKIAVVGIATSPVAQAASTMTSTSDDPGAVTVTATAAEPYDGVAGNGWTVLLVDSGEGGLSAVLNASAKRITVDLGGADSTAALIAAAVNDLTGFDAAEESAGDFTIAADEGKSVTLAGGTGGLLASLDELVETRDDWYFLLSTDRAAEDIEELASWVAANHKLYVACPDENVADTIALAGVLASDRTALIYHDDPDSCPDAAWVGRCAPELPGSITWKFKTLDGIAPADVTTTNVSDLHAANVQTYVQKYGVNQTSEGKVTSGEYIDVIRSQDFVEARLSEAISRLLFTSPKVPFDNRGIALVVAEVLSVMQLATGQGIIARDNDGNGIFEVTAPDISEVSANDKANRNLPNVHFAFTLAGAVHQVEVRGVIQV